MAHGVDWEIFLVDYIYCLLCPGLSPQLGGGGGCGPTFAGWSAKNVCSVSLRDFDTDYGKINPTPD